MKRGANNIIKDTYMISIVLEKGGRRTKFMLISNLSFYLSFYIRLWEGCFRKKESGIVNNIPNGLYLLFFF